MVQNFWHVILECNTLRCVSYGITAPLTIIEKKIDFTQPIIDFQEKNYLSIPSLHSGIYWMTEVVVTTAAVERANL